MVVMFEYQNLRRVCYNCGGEGLKQRIADARNYLLFLAACLEEGEDAD